MLTTRRRHGKILIVFKKVILAGSYQK